MNQLSRFLNSQSPTVISLVLSVVSIIVSALGLSLGFADTAKLGSSSTGSSNVSTPSAHTLPDENGPQTRKILWSESFDDVPNHSEFTHTMPEGWESSTEGVNSGEARWNGWTLSTIRHWTWAVGTDMRHWFTQGHGNVAIIESEHQRLNDVDLMDAHLTTAPISIKGNDKVAVEFDHHYRQGKAGQSATVSVVFDDGKSQTLEEFTADKFSAHEYYEVDIPAGAKSLQIKFDYLQGNNDFWWAVDNVSVNEPFTEVVGEPEAIIDVLSDMQDDNDDYRDAIRQLNAMPDKADGLALNGDIVDVGSVEQWDNFMAAHTDTPHASGKELWTIGNHEMYGPEGSQVYMDRFLKHSGQEKPWAEVVAGGVPMIGISTEYYSDVDRGGKEPFQRLSQEQLDWLDSRLAYWRDKGTPVLVFTHTLLPQTVSMSHSAWYQNDSEDLEALSDVLNKYNHIVAFTSHSHSSLEQDNWWGVRRYDGTGAAGAQGFPVVNTGAVLNAYLPDGDHDETIVKEKVEANSGLRVKVYGDRIRVEAWDFKAGKMMKFQDFSR